MLYFKIIKPVKMNLDIKTIQLEGKIGNCYLIKTKIGYILIVTGKKTNKMDLQDQLLQYGCTQDNLNLIIFTNNKQVNKSVETARAPVTTPLRRARQADFQ